MHEEWQHGEKYTEWEWEAYLCYYRCSCQLINMIPCKAKPAIVLPIFCCCCPTGGAGCILPHLLSIIGFHMVWRVRDDLQGHRAHGLQPAQSTNSVLADKSFICGARSKYRRQVRKAGLLPLHDCLQRRRRAAAERQSCF